MVSVPSFGDSFFIRYGNEVERRGSRRWFPSPHSGILFLYWKERRIKMKVSSSFRPLIRGFFFYGFPQGPQHKVKP